MDKKLNEDIEEPIDEGLSGVGQNRPRDSEGFNHPRETRQAMGRDERETVEDLAAPERQGGEPGERGNDDNRPKAHTDPLHHDMKRGAGGYAPLDQRDLGASDKDDRSPKIR